MAMAYGGPGYNQKRDAYGAIIGADQPGGQNYVPPFVQPNAPSQAAPFQPNPNLWNNQNIPANPWNQSITGGSSGFINGAGQPLPAQGAPPPAGPTPGPMQGGYFDMINKAYDAQDALSQAQGKRIWQSSAADQGLLPADLAGQALYAQTMAPINQQLAAGRAGALADAYGRDQAQQMQAQQLQMQREQAQQEQAFRQQQFAAQQAQAQQEQQFRQQQVDYARQQDAAAQAWQKTQQEWAVQDRLRATQAQQQQQMTQQQALRQPLTGVAGPVNTGVSNNGESAAETFARLQGGDPTSFAPVTSTGHAMGGGAGLAGGQASPGGGGLDANTAAFRTYQDRNNQPWVGSGSNTGTASPGYAAGPSSVGSSYKGPTGIGAGIAGAATSGAPLGSPPGYTTQPAWKSGFK